MKKLLFTVILFAALVLTLIPCAAFGAVRESVLQEEYGNVVCKDSVSKVVLYGSSKDGGYYYGHVRIEVQDKQSGKAILTIRPQTDGGYAPSIILADFAANGLKQIYLGMDSGGSGGYQYSYVYGAKDGKKQVLFDYAAFDKKYTAKYADGFRVSVAGVNTDVEWLIDISQRSTEYLNELYNPDGTLIKPVDATVSGLVNAFPFYNTSLGRFGLLATQEIYGLYHADKFGYVEHFTEFDGKNFQPYLTGILIF